MSASRSESRFGAISNGWRSFRALRGPAPRATPLLEQLLESQAESHLRNVFGLLSLLHSPEHIWAAYRGLTEGGESTRAHALEYLDNTLEGEMRRNVMAALDERNIEDKLRDFGLRLGVREVSRAEVLSRCPRGRGERCRCGLVAFLPPRRCWRFIMRRASAAAAGGRPGLATRTLSWPRPLVG